MPKCIQTKKPNLEEEVVILSRKLLQADLPITFTTPLRHPISGILFAFMVYHHASSGANSDMGPFNGNTRVVAVIALTVAGLFVFLGLILSLIRAMQQRAAERVCLLAD